MATNIEKVNSLGRGTTPTELWSTFSYFCRLTESDWNQCPKQPGITANKSKTWNKVSTAIKNKVYFGPLRHNSVNY